MLPDPTDPRSSHRYIPNAGEDIREMLAVDRRRVASIVSSIRFRPTSSSTRCSTSRDRGRRSSRVAGFAGSPRATSPPSITSRSSAAARTRITSRPASISSCCAPSSSPRTRRISPRSRRERCSRSSNTRRTSACSPDSTSPTPRSTTARPRCARRCCLPSGLTKGKNKVVIAQVGPSAVHRDRAHLRAEPRHRDRGSAAGAPTAASISTRCARRDERTSSPWPCSRRTSSA